jgi:hypothetical protein
LSFWKTFHDHGWTKWKFIILLGIPKTKKQEEDELLQREKKTFKLLYFQISYLSHFLFVLNNVKNYGSTIWSFTKHFWSAKTIEWHSKILSSRMQIGHICQLTCPWPLSLGENISYSNFHRFERILLHWMCHLKLYKTFLKCKTIEWRWKILSCKMQIDHMCQPTSCLWPPSFGKGTPCSSFIDSNDFCCIGCIKWRTKKCFWAPKATEQCTKIYKSLSLSYQHVYSSNCN